MPKFFIETEKIRENKEIWIIGENVNHIKNVLRKKVNDTLKLCDKKTGINYEGKILKIEKEKIICKIIKKAIGQAESNLNLTIFQGLPKADKMELIIQKTTELGVKKIIPVNMKRSIVKIKDKKSKILRWQKIAEVAAKQSGRDLIPKVEEIINLDDVSFNEYDQVLVLYENEDKKSIKEIVNKLKEIKKQELSIGIIIGPEGGFEETEISQLNKAQNVSIVTLGKRILRTETVALVVSGILMYELGDLN